MGRGPMLGNAALLLDAAITSPRYSSALTSRRCSTVREKTAGHPISDDPFAIDFSSVYSCGQDLLY